MKESGDLLQWAMGGLASVVAALWLFVLKLRGDFSEHKIEVAKTYVCKDDIKEMVKEVKSHTDERADRIEDKVDRLIAERSEGR